MNPMSPLHPKPKISHETLICLMLGGLITCLIITILLLPEIFVREENDSSIFHLRKPSASTTAMRLTQHTTRPKMVLPISELQSIVCADGSFGYINDDYCDCADGSDEPSTSACSHILVGKQVFACDMDKTLLYASRIGDGIMDCKEQADE